MQLMMTLKVTKTQSFTVSSEVFFRNIFLELMSGVFLNETSTLVLAE